MPDAFNPYWEWLAIPLSEQPPTLYRLLGLAPFEHSKEVITAAADARMNVVRAYQLGPHADVCQRLLNEIAAARVQLLDRARREAYDASLRLAAPLAQSLAPLPLAATVPGRVPLAKDHGQPAGAPSPPQAKASEVGPPPRPTQGAFSPPAQDVTNARSAMEILRRAAWESVESGTFRPQRTAPRGRPLFSRRWLYWMAGLFAAVALGWLFIAVLMAVVEGVASNSGPVDPVPPPPDPPQPLHSEAPPSTGEDVPPIKLEPGTAYAGRPAGLPCEFVAYSWQQTWYWFSRDVLSLPAAQDAAGMLQGRLASIESPDEHEFVVRHWPQRAGYLLLGMTRLADQTLGVDSQPLAIEFWCERQSAFPQSQPYVVLASGCLRWHTVDGRGMYRVCIESSLAPDPAVMQPLEGIPLAPAATPGAMPQDRVVWRAANRDLVFRRTAEGWEEVSGGTVAFHFREVQRSAEHVVLHDAGRNLYVILRSDRAEWAEHPSAAGQPIYTGSWER